MNLLIAFFLVNFSLVCSLQLIKVEEILQLKDYTNLQVTGNLLNDAVKCIEEYEAANFDFHFKIIIFGNCDSILINFAVHDVKVYCSYITTQDLITFIAISKETTNISFSSEHRIHGLLLPFQNSVLICNCTCDDTTCNDASIVTNKYSIFDKHQNACYICDCNCINASKVTSAIHINKMHSITNFTMSLSQRLKQAQENNKSLDFPLEFKPIHDKCHKLVSALPLIKCVNKSLLLRPPMTWIGCEKNCTQILYSKNCFVDYCLLTASYLKLNISTIDAQCNYGRTGHICGYCPKGYDSVFGAKPKCKKCTNIWFLVILVLGVAGFLLVIVLFVLNLTVTKGLINGYVLYTNIVGMENMNIFPSDHNSILPIVVDISNLNLGIETCFYKGMTDFDKQWLQLVFPFYLIFIVGLIAVGSRYSVTIEKLTRRRVISVLATLLFLSYNKLLLTATTVLFYYQPVYHLETNKYELLWPVDTSVTLFNVKFILLFAACLLIFVVFLIPINIILLFPAYCFKFRRVVYFKPFIDAFQAPYRDKFRYSIGIELLIRLIAYIFNAVSVVDYYQKFGVNVVIFLLYFSYITMIQPYKSYYKTVLHWSFILNLGFIISLQIYRFSYISESSYLLLLCIVIIVAYIEFACIVIYEAFNIVYDSILRKQEIPEDIEVPGEHEELQEELLIY